MGIDEESSTKIVQHVLREVAAVVREKLGASGEESSDSLGVSQGMKPTTGGRDGPGTSSGRCTPGQRCAREKLITEHLHLVAPIARGFGPPWQVLAADNRSVSEAWRRVE